MKHLLLIFILAFSSSLFANDSTPQNQLPTVGGSPTRATKQKTVAKPAAAKVVSDEVSGQCVILPGGGNLVPIPCSAVILHLTSGKDVVSARTDAEGMFSFITEYGKKYQVSAESRLYVIDSPTAPISSGEKLEIHLKYK